MNTLRLLKRNVWHYRRQNLLMLFGVAITGAIITGSLILGDSVQYSLRALSQVRTGKIQWVFQGPSGHFRAELAGQVQEDLGAAVAPILASPAIAAAPGGQPRVPQATVVGVDERFFSLSASGKPRALQPGQALLNAKMARQLNLAAGDELLIFIQKPAALPSDAPFSAERETLALRLQVRAVLLPPDFGDFSLNINPEVPANIFVRLPFLAEQLGLPGRANTLLIPQNATRDLNATRIGEALSAHWQTSDAGLKQVSLTRHRQFELRSSDVFISHQLARTLRQAFPQAIPLFTYFVNALEKGGRATPYSLVSSLPPQAGLTLKDNEIVINTWLAADLRAGAGDQIILRYYTIDAGRKLKEEETAFTVRTVTPLRWWAKDPTLMPDFPGLSDAGNCRDWKPGIPIDLDKIRDKDEVYWDQYRGTPKAFVTLAAAQRLWSNPFGNLTGLRFSLQDQARVMRQLDALLTPAEFGFQLLDLKTQSAQSAEESIDFSQLFLGLSFFMVMAALLLIALFFTHAVEQRATEIQTYRALGWPTPAIRRLFLQEGLLLAGAGSLLGVVLGVLYNQALLYGLTTIWIEAVRTTALQVALRPATLALGFLSTVVLAALSILLCLRSLFRQSISARPRNQPLPAWVAWLNGGVFLFLLSGILYYLFTRQAYSPLLFILFGTLFLASGLVAFLALFAKLDNRDRPEALTAWSLGLRNINRRLQRSVAIVAMLAIGLFMIIAVSANRQNEWQDAASRASGTGGFVFFGTTTEPLTKDLNATAGRKHYGLDAAALAGTSFVQLRLKPGNDASCLNINRTFAPRVLGVDPAALARRNAFTFSTLDKGLAGQLANPWALLNATLPDGAVPAIADQTVIQWGLGKKLGDTITLQNDQGTPIVLQLTGGLANSIFQGHVLISEQNMLKHFPAIGGWQVMLVDGPRERKDETRQELARALLPLGITLEDTAGRLAEFNSVQNTYLSIFLMLGGLGLMLSTLGLGIVLARNVMERRGELALLSAVGHAPGRMKIMLWSEHLVLLLAGVVIGTFSGLVAVLPMLTAPGTRIPYALLGAVVCGILLVGSISLYLAGAWALPKNLTQGLRTE